MRDVRANVERSSEKYAVVLKLTAISHTDSIPRLRRRLKRTFKFAGLRERIREILKITHPGVQCLSTIVQPQRTEYPLRLSERRAATPRKNRHVSMGSGLPTVSKQFVDTATNTQIASNSLVMSKSVRRSEKNVFRCQDETITRTAFIFARPYDLNLRSLLHCKSRL